MLARENRLLTADDFRTTMRTGRKTASANLVTYFTRIDEPKAARFGFVVAKTVGNAVQRNLVKRRLREISRPLVAQIPTGWMFVVRALETAKQAPFSQLQEELSKAVSTALDRGSK